MNKPNVSGLLKTVAGSLSKHSPAILAGIGIAGMITTVVLAVKATPKALERIEEEKDRQNEELLEEAKEQGRKNAAQVDKLKPTDVVKVTWKCYIPAIVTGVLSISCIVGGSSVNARRNAALAAAYGLSEKALTEYKEKTVEMVGEKKEREIRDEIAKDTLKKNPVSNNDIVVTENGNSLCYDQTMGGYFWSDIEKVRQAINELNKRLMTEMYVSVNDLYFELGRKSIDNGDDLGWNIDKGLIDVDFSSAIAENGQPCLVISYSCQPRYDFRDLC